MLGKNNATLRTRTDVLRTYGSCDRVIAEFGCWMWRTPMRIVALLLALLFPSVLYAGAPHSRPDVEWEYTCAASKGIVAIQEQLMARPNAAVVLIIIAHNNKMPTDACYVGFVPFHCKVHVGQIKIAHTYFDLWAYRENQGGDRFRQKFVVHDIADRKRHQRSLCAK